MGSIEEFIANYHLVVDTSKSSDEILYIRSSIRSEKEVKSFMQKFEQKTCTIWRVHYGNYNPKRVVFRRAWVCRHSSVRNTDVEENNCEAKLDILVKKINSYTMKNDAFLLKEPPLPCIIRMRFKHNHSYKDDIKYLKIPDEVKELYYSYFDTGYGVAKALRLHEQRLKRDETFSVVNFVPSNRQVYYLYRQWQRRHNDLDIAENNIVNKDPWVVFNWDDLINAIPRENPPVKIEKKVSDSQSPNFSDEENYESKYQVSPTNVIKMEKISNSVMATISCAKNESLPPKTVYIIGAPMAQQIASSSNHMNGSVVTVMNSNCVAPCSTLVSNSIASIITPISSPIHLGNIPVKPFVHFLEKNSSETKLNSKDTSNASLNNLEAFKSRSNYLHQSKVLDLSKNDITPISTSNELKNEQCFNLLNKISQSYETIINSKGGHLSPTIHNGLTKSNNQTSCAILDRKQKSKTCDFLNSSASLSFQSIKPKDSIHDASSVNALFKSHVKCSESSTNTQIHITNTVHQSGAQVSMKSSIPSTVNILHVSELLDNSTPPEEPIKIKDEPPEEDDSDFSPTIIKIASVDVSEKVKLEPSIEIEKTVGNVMEKSSSKSFSDDSANSSQVSTTEEEKDEDHRFLIALLQELKQLPNPLKNKLKREMQSLVSSALIKENCRKRRKL